MPSESREVRPRNFPPRHSSGASRRFFLVQCLTAVLATPVAARDLGIPLAEISASGGSVPATISEFITVAYQQADQDAAGEQPEVEEVPATEPSVDLNAATNFGLKPMSAMSVNISAPSGDGDFPEDVATARFDREPRIDPAQCVGRDWAMMDYRWEASMLCHGPLLFEQLNAERYGITYGCLQPVISGAHFFATVPTIPYKVWANGHDQCQYALGYYRPGSYARPQCYKLRVSADASLFEAGVILGLIFALP